MQKKLSNEEFEEIQDLRKSVSEVATILGDLNYQKMVLDIMIEEQKSKVTEIKRKEASVFEKIRTNYGNVSVNIETGEIS